MLTIHLDDFAPGQVYPLGRRTVSRDEIAAFARPRPALSRAVFSSDDNLPDVSEAERDESQGYFDRMLERLQHLGYPWSMLLQESSRGADPSDEGPSQCSIAAAAVAAPPSPPGSVGRIHRPVFNPPSGKSTSEPASHGPSMLPAYCSVGD